MPIKPALRRNRTPHLNSSTVKGRAKQFRPSDDDWRRIEEACCWSLNAKDRLEILEIVDRYLLWAPHEISTLNANDVMRKIENVRKASAALMKELYSLYDAEKTDEDKEEGTKENLGTTARLWIERGQLAEIEPSVLAEVGSAADDGDIGRAADLLMATRRASSKSTVSVEALMPRLTKLEAACHQAAEKLAKLADDRRGFDIGDAWVELIRELLIWAQQAGRPTRVSTNREQLKPSEFVRFVWSLQQSFPIDPNDPTVYRRHTHSEPALADAMLPIARTLGTNSKPTES